MIPSLTLFVHVVGVLTLFVGLGLEWASLDGVQRSMELRLCGQRRPIRFCGCLYAFASPLAWPLCFS